MVALKWFFSRSRSTVPALRPTLVSLLPLLGVFLGPARLPAEGARVPVLLELFTSEGCSSCPAADDLLARLGKEQPLPGIEIIPVAWHVDYWDHLGWKDRFASRDYTARQYAYAQKKGWEQVYTPQAVVQGQDHAVGSDRRRILALTKAAAQKPVQRLKLQVRKTPGGRRIFVAVTGAMIGTPLTVALVEESLVSDVKAGENAGVKLKHSDVVRISGAANTVYEDGKSSWDAYGRDFQRETGILRAVAWQEEDGAVVAVGRSPKVFW